MTPAHHLGKLFWPLCASVMLVLANDSSAERTKETALSTSSLYPVRFGSPRRDSQQSESARAEGRIEWSQPLHLQAGSLPRAVLQWGDGVLVDSGEVAQRFGADGKLQWAREKLPAAPAVIGNNQLYFVNRLRSLQAVDAGNAVQLDDAPIAALATAEFSLMLFWPQAADFVASAYMPDPSYDEEAVDQPTPEPMLLATRTVYGNVMPAWHVDFSGELQLPPLYNPERAEWLVAYGDVRVINVQRGAQVASFKQPLETPLDWSVDRAGTVCISGYNAGHKVVAALDGDGKPRWTWTDPADDERWAETQPPVRSASGRVYVLTRGRVLAINEGRLLWSYDARSEGLRHGALAHDGSFELRDGQLLSTERLRHATVLADDSVLVTGRKTLRQVDALGRRVFSLAFPDELLTPPMVDATGAIYVATATTLYKVR